MNRDEIENEILVKLHNCEFYINTYIISNDINTTKLLLAINQKQYDMNVEDTELLLHIQNLNRYMRNTLFQKPFWCDTSVEAFNDMVGYNILKPYKPAPNRFGISYNMYEVAYNIIKTYYKNKLSFTTWFNYHSLGKVLH